KNARFKKLYITGPNLLTSHILFRQTKQNDSKDKSSNSITSKLASPVFQASDNEYEDKSSNSSLIPQIYINY
ncbi:9384_t:CDS:1, partial [Dentiscutata erythropus]